MAGLSLEGIEKDFGAKRPSPPPIAAEPRPQEVPSVTSPLRKITVIFVGADGCPPGNFAPGESPEWLKKVDTRPDFINDDGIRSEPIPVAIVTDGYYTHRVLKHYQ
ncbi:MAG TPA: hypothetical protein VJZ27_06395 [Aggregatilineales bacterium]|nr:hypothetical protein [Aggregatilineales bacterium]